MSAPRTASARTIPGKPKAETTTYLTEYRQTLPAKVYSAADALGRYSTTVVDYRGIEKMHADRAAKCQAAKGANQQDGDTCQNDFRVDVAGATDHAVWNYMKRDGVKMTSYMFYFVELVSGRLLQMTNAGQDAHLRGRFISMPADSISTRRPSLRACPSRSCSCSRWDGPTRRGWRFAIGGIYTEGYGEWKFPHEPPPFTVRDLNTSIDGTVVRPPR